ncbi:MAG: single-stranded DNA-binding protein [Bacteroidota bacterium]
MVNEVKLIGNLGRDPQVKEFDSGRTAARISVACNEYYNGQTKTTWVDVLAWGKVAENMEKSLRKGDQIYVDGKLSVHVYEREGEQRKVMEVVANSFRRLNPRKEE